MFRHLIIAMSAAGGVTLATCADAPSTDTARQDSSPQAQGASTGTEDEGQQTRPAPDPRAEERVDIARLAREVRAAADEGPADPAEWLKLNIADQAAPHPVWHETVMPGQTMTLSADHVFTLSVDGEARDQLATQHSWTAPGEPGIHEMIAFDEEGRFQQLTIFVLAPVPSGSDAVMEGYRIGSYPRNTPEGLIRLADA